jgi:hypothetical protein
MNNTHQSNNDLLARFRELGIRHATELRILLTAICGPPSPQQSTPEFREFVKAWARGWAKGFGLDEPTADEIFAECSTAETETCEVRPADS